MIVSNFPHNPRFIAAYVVHVCENILLWTGLTSFIMFNILTFINTSSGFASARTGLLENPFERSSHQSFALSLWQTGLRQTAILEITLAEQFRDTGTKVLGAVTNQTFTTWDEEKVVMEKQTTYWKTIVAEKPDYRDGYITLASLAYQLGNKQESRKYLEQALLLDPDNEAARQLSILNK